MHRSRQREGVCVGCFVATAISVTATWWPNDNTYHVDRQQLIDLQESSLSENEVIRRQWNAKSIASSSSRNSDRKWTQVLS